MTPEIKVISGRLAEKKSDAEYEHKIYQEFLKAHSPNFFYECEKRLITNSLSYVGKYKSDNCVSFDMNKAFYTVINNNKISNHNIGVFTMHNIIELYDNSKIIPHNYYFISEKYNLPMGYTNNLLHGFEVLFIDIPLEYITHMKRATYTIKVSLIQKLLKKIMKDEKIDVNDENQVKMFKKRYPLHNGMLGRVFKRFESTEVLDVSSDDVDLFKYNEKYMSVMTGSLTNSCQFKRKDIYLYINNRNIYNYVISRTKIEMLTVKNNIFNKTGLNPVKITTDSLTYDVGINNKKDFEKHLPLNFKIEDTRQTFNNISMRYLRADDMMEQQKMKLNSFTEKMTIFTGAPGTGKTTLIKKEYKYDYATTISNVCANIIGGTTLYKFLKLSDPSKVFRYMNMYKDKVIWIDEFSMINKYYWNYLYMLKDVVKEFIFTGDRNQIGAVGDPIFKNNYFDNIFDNKAKELKTDYRNGKKIIDLRNDILNSTIEEVNYIISKNLNTKEYGKTHLVYTHNYRKFLNNYIMKKNNYVFDLDAIENKWSISDGVILKSICNITTKKIYKNAIYKVISKVNWRNKFVYLQPFGSDELVKLDLKYMIHFTLGFAVTVHSCQGLTIVKNFHIHQYTKMITRDKSILYTAVTRGKSLNNISFVNQDKNYNKFTIYTETNVSNTTHNFSFSNISPSK